MGDRVWSRLVCTVVGALLVMAAWLAPAAAVAAEPPPIPADLAADGVDGFVSRLTDGEARVLLIEQLKLSADDRRAEDTVAPVPAGGGLLMSLHLRGEEIGRRGAEVEAALADLPLYGSMMLRNLTDQEGWPAVAHGAGVLAVLVAAALAVEALARRAFADPRRRMDAAAAGGWGGRLAVAGIASALNAIALALFAATAFGLSFVFFARFDPMRVLVAAVVLVIVVARAAHLVAGVVLAPARGDRRLVPIGDGAAAALSAWIVALTVVGAGGFTSAGVLSILGLPEPLYALLAVAVGTVLAAMAAILILRCRRPVVRLLAGDPAAGATGGATVQVAAAAWHLLAIAYLAMVWLVWAINTFLGHAGPAATALSGLLVVLLVPAVDWLVRAGLDHLARRRQGEVAGPVRPSRLRRVIVHGVRAILVASGLVLVVEAWTGAVFVWLDTAVGRRIGSAALDIFVASVLAFAVWELLTSATERHLQATDDGDEAAAAGDGEFGTMPVQSRMATLMPLLRTTVLVVLVAMVVMITLSSIGVDIGPLLAGAGVVGIAVGFGAQTLVRDIVSGIFFLIDDAFRLGEYIEIDDKIRGQVEKISLRSMQLRHHRGPLLTLPFGELRSITNHNRDWAIYKQEFRVPYDTDLTRVKKIIKTIGAELMQDPEYGPKLLEPLKSQGVTRMDDSALIIRTKFKSKPGQQFTLRRVVFQKVQEAFAANGIEFAQRRVAVTLPGGADGGPPSPERLRAAAEAAADSAPPSAPDQSQHL